VVLKSQISRPITLLIRCQRFQPSKIGAKYIISRIGVKNNLLHSLHIALTLTRILAIAENYDVLDVGGTPIAYMEAGIF